MLNAYFSVYFFCIRSSLMQERYSLMHAIVILAMLYLFLYEMYIMSMLRMHAIGLLQMYRLEELYRHELNF